MHALAGELGRINLSSVLQLIRSDALDGRLVLDAGWIGLVGGQPVAASCGELDGELALLELFVQPSERFHLDATQSHQGEPLGDLIALLMDGCRLNDEWERTRDQGVAFGEGVELPEWLQAAEEDLRAGYALEVCARRSGVAGVEIVESVLELVELGDARLVEASEPPLELDYYGALELGREHYRAKEWELARRAFQRALECRPEDRIATQNLRATERRAREHA